MAETFTYDVFISHSAKDKPAVRELAERLRKDGLRVWLDDWEIKPGDAILRKIQAGLEQSRTLVLAMSGHASKSEWVTFEHHSWLFRDLSAGANQQRRFIPVRLDDTEIRDALKQFAYVDWRQRDEEQYARLLAACRSAVAETERVTERKVQARPSKVLEGHAAAVWGVAVYPDGQRIVSSSNDNVVRIWDLKTGGCLAYLKGHTANVNGVAVTPDGRHIVSGSKDKTVRVWVEATGECLTTLVGHMDEVFGVAVMPDGQGIVSTSSDCTVRVWELKTGKCLTILKGHVNPVIDVAVTPDGMHIVSASNDDTLRLWEIATGKCIVTFEGHTGSVWGVAVTPNGKHIVSGSRDRTIRVWELKTGKCLMTIEGHSGKVTDVVVTPNGRYIISASWDCSVRIWELETGRCVATLEGHTGSVLAAAVTPDGRHVVSGSDDKTVRVWGLPPDDKESAESEAARYTNAKVLLVGDSGVGKSGLALRLTEDRFEPTISTDGAVVTRVSDEWATQLSVLSAGRRAFEKKLCRG